jgi:hypothetical protein
MAKDTASPIDLAGKKQPLFVRGVRYVSKRAAQKTFTSSSMGKKLAKEADEDNTLINAIAAYGVTKIGTRSVPGAVLVGGALVAKTLYDRSEKRRKSLAAKEAKQASKKARKRPAAKA